VLFFLLWTRFGREYRVSHDVGEYLRDLPDDPPAFVSMLRNWGTVSPSLLSATLVDLAQRGHLTIEETRKDRLILPDKVDWRFTAATPPAAHPDALRPFEATILARVFADGPSTLQSEFTAWCRTHRTTAQRWWEDVKSDATTDFKAKGYIEGGKGPVYAANIVIGGAVGAIGFGAVSSGSVLGVVAIVSGLVQMMVTVVLRRRTPAGRQRLAEWDAVERFLRDFSELEKAPVASLVIWERYLVYAVALGVTAVVARALAARIPAEERTAAGGFAPWYVGMHGPGALDSIGSLSDFASSIGPQIVAAATPRSSSSSGGGGGGGFSGGGGGGGGGGGIGAS